MGKFMLGLVLGSLFTGTIVAAGDYLNRSETQAQFDYFRSRAQALDIEHMRRAQDEERFNQQIEKLGKSPC